MAKSKPKQTRRICFTLNNYTPEEVEAITHPAPPLTYVLFGYEVGEQGTPHLQGYVELAKKITFAGLQKLPGYARTSLRVAGGDAAENLTYCSKEDPNPFIWGEPIPEPGVGEKRRWSEARELARTGDFDSIDDQIYLSHRSSLHAIHADAIWSAGDRHSVPSIVLTQWQARVVDIIKVEPHPRKIYFVVDPTGGAGKSTFARYLRHCFPDSLQVLLPGAHKDLAYVLKPSRAYIIDIPRSSSEHVSWPFLEAVKNGYVLSSKYESMIKDFPTPHVFVFANQQPPDGMLSQDRMEFISVN